MPTPGQTANLNISNARTQLGLIDNWAINSQLDSIHEQTQAALVTLQPICEQLVVEGMPENQRLDPADALTSAADASAAFGRASFLIGQVIQFCTDNADYPGVADTLQALLNGFQQGNLLNLIGSVVVQ